MKMRKLALLLMLTGFALLMQRPVDATFCDTYPNAWYCETYTDHDRCQDPHTYCVQICDTEAGEHDGCAGDSGYCACDPPPDPGCADAWEPCEYPSYDCCDPANWCLEDWGVCVVPS